MNNGISDSQQPLNPPTEPPPPTTTASTIEAEVKEQILHISVQEVLDWELGTDAIGSLTSDAPALDPGLAPPVTADADVSMDNIMPTIPEEHDNDKQNQLLATPTSAPTGIAKRLPLN